MYLSTFNFMLIFILNFTDGKNSQTSLDINDYIFSTNTSDVMMLDGEN